MNVIELIERAHAETELEREIRRLLVKLAEAEATRNALREILAAHHMQRAA